MENESSADDGVANDASYAFGLVDWNAGWQSAILRLTDVAEDMNTDKSRRAQPRHRNVTDPLVLEAVVNDGLEEKIRKRWTFIYNVGNKSWVRFNQVPLGEGYRRFRVVYGNATDSLRHVEVRLDSVEGPLVGSVPLSRTDRPRTGRIQIYGEAVAELAPKATGNRDVFVVFHAADNQPVGEFEYFRFEQYRGDLPLGKNEVKLELRVGSRTGPRSASSIRGRQELRTDPATSCVHSSRCKARSRCSWSSVRP